MVVQERRWRALKGVVEKGGGGGGGGEVWPRCCVLYIQDGVVPFQLRFQELDLSTEALIGFGESQREAEWTDAVKRALMDLGRYDLVQSVRLVGMMMLVFVQESLLPYVTEVESDTVATGLLGVAVSETVTTGGSGEGATAWCVCVCVRACVCVCTCVC